MPNLSHHEPICIDCLVNYACERNEILIRLTPDRIVHADLWQCPQCGRRAIHGVARAYASRFDSPELFAEWDTALTALGDDIIVGAPHKGEVFARAGQEASA